MNKKNQVNSLLGYKSYSPDVNNPYNIIDSGRITMQDVDFPVQAIDYNTGNNLGVMQPNKEYDFSNTTNKILEIPLNNNNMYSRKELRQQMYRYQMGGQPMQTEDPQMQYNQSSQQGQPELPPEIMELLQAFFEMMQLPPEEQQAFMQEFMSSTPEEQQQIIQEVQMQLQGGQEQQPQQQMQEPMMEEQMQVGGRFGMFQVAGNTPSVNMELQKRVDGNYKKEQKKNDSESSYYNEEQLIPTDKILPPTTQEVSNQPELVKELYAPTYGYTNGSRKVMAVNSRIQGDGTRFGMFNNNQNSNVSDVQPEIIRGSFTKEDVKEIDKKAEELSTIRDVQSYLKNNGFYGDSKRNEIDGIFGNRSSNALMKLQESANLKQTGTVDKPTADYLKSIGMNINPFSKFKGVTKPVTSKGISNKVISDESFNPKYNGNSDGFNLGEGVIVGKTNSGGWAAKYPNGNIVSLEEEDITRAKAFENYKPPINNTVTKPNPDYTPNKLANYEYNSLSMSGDENGNYVKINNKGLPVSVDKKTNKEKPLTINEKLRVNQLNDYNVSVNNSKNLQKANENANQNFLSKTKSLINTQYSTGINSYYELILDEKGNVVRRYKDNFGSYKGFGEPSKEDMQDIEKARKFNTLNK